MQRIWCGPPAPSIDQTNEKENTLRSWELATVEKMNPQEMIGVIQKYGLENVWIHTSLPMLVKTLILHQYKVDQKEGLKLDDIPWIYPIAHQFDEHVQLGIHFYKKNEKLKTGDLLRILDNAIEYKLTHLWIIGRLNWVESSQTTLKSVLENYYASENDQNPPLIKLWNEERFAFDDTDHQLAPMVSKIQPRDLQHLSEDVDQMAQLGEDDPVSIRLNLKSGDLVLFQRCFPNKHFHVRVVK